MKKLEKAKYIITNIKDSVNLEKYTNHPLYKTYYGMKDRCYNLKAQHYNNYGGRGILVCDEWIDKEFGIKNFIEWAEQNKYKENSGLTLDRIENDKGYFPDNCRFTTWDIQMLNRRNTKKSTIDGHNIEEYNGLFLTNLYYNGKTYPIGTFNTLDKAIKEKEKLYNKLEELSNG